METYFLGLAGVLVEKASEHSHYADFENDEIAAAEHRGIAQAFGYMADKIMEAVDEWGEGPDRSSPSPQL